ncbi:MAG: hypothetical protein R3E79_48645 [Caldilineaceae bacterium]
MSSEKPWANSRINPIPSQGGACCATGVKLVKKVSVHQINNDVLARTYIGRRFKDDTERLEKLVELHTQMTA